MSRQVFRGAVITLVPILLLGLQAACSDPTGPGGDWYGTRSTVATLEFNVSDVQSRAIAGNGRYTYRGYATPFNFSGTHTGDSLLFVLKATVPGRPDATFRGFVSGDYMRGTLTISLYEWEPGNGYGQWGYQMTLNRR
jgi:hypothetical protein